MAILLVFSKPNTKEEEAVIESIHAVLRKQNADYNAVDRHACSKKDVKKTDLVITAGGDGTFLTVSHYLDDSQRILGVNTNTGQKEGFLLTATKKTFASVLEQYLKGKHSIQQLPTLKATVNGVPADTFAVNDFFFGSPKSYLTARYDIEFSKKKETHRSSGVVIATSVGINAWVHSVLCGSVENITENQAQFVVREPYEQKVFSRYAIKQGVLNSGMTLRIQSKMQDAIIVADSLSKEYAVQYDDWVEFSLSRRKICVVK